MQKAVLAMVLCGAMATAAHAQVSDEQARLACEADAMRLCSEAIPDRPRIAQCLRANIQQISASCKAVLEAGRPAAKP